MNRNSGSIWMVLLLVASVIAGCSNEGNPAQSAKTARTGNEYVPPETYGPGERDALRIKTDTARGRVWVLGLDNVRVYDTVRKRLIRQIELPSWSVARFVCMPDMALDRSGTAYISSNAQPRLWRIDADSFEVRVHEISLHRREQWDIGFGALAFAADGTLLALSSPVESLWRIDIGKASARIVEENTSLRNVCEITMQFLGNFEGSQKP
jgi:hypothetical protein